MLIRLGRSEIGAPKERVATPATKPVFSTRVLSQLGVSRLACLARVCCYGLVSGWGALAPFSWGENRRLHGRRDTASPAGCYHGGVLNGDPLADGDARRTGSATHLHLGD